MQAKHRDARIRLAGEPYGNNLAHRSGFREKDELDLRVAKRGYISCPVVLRYECSRGRAHVPSGKRSISQLLIAVVASPEGERCGRVLSKPRRQQPRDSEAP